MPTEKPRKLPEDGSDTFGVRFGRLVKRRRGEEGLTQLKLAGLAFGDEEKANRISEIENGMRSRPQQKTVDALTVALNLAESDIDACIPQKDFRRTKHISLPNQPPRRLTGRSEVISRVEVAMSSAVTPKVVAITGMAGVGKSTIALDYAWRYLENYSIVWWIVSDSAVSITSGLVALAQALKLLDVKKSHPEGAWLKALNDWFPDADDTLLIFDGPSDLDLLKESVPVIKSCSVLITCRSPISTPYVSDEIAIDTWTSEEAVEYIQTYTGSKEERPCFELAQLLGGLPLALEQAVGYCREVGCSIPSYVQLFQTNAERLLRRKPKSGAEAVWVTFEISVYRLAEVNTTASQFLFTLSCFDAGPIPLKFFGNSSTSPLSGLDEFEVNDVIQVLVEFALIKRLDIYDTIRDQIGFDCVQLHTLVQAVARSLSNPEHFEAAFSSFCSGYPTSQNDPEEFPELRIRSTLIQSFVNECNKLSDNDRVRLVLTMVQDARYRAFGEADYKGASKRSLESLNILNPLHNMKNIGVITSSVQRNLAGYLNNLENDEGKSEARKIYKDVAEYVRSLWGENSPLYARSLIDLAEIAIGSSDSSSKSDAITIANKAVTICENSILTEENEEIKSSNLQLLGSIKRSYASILLHTKDRSHQRVAIGILDNMLADKLVVSSLNQIEMAEIFVLRGTLKWSTEQWNGAEQDLKRAIEIFNLHLDEQHESISLANIALKGVLARRSGPFSSDASLSNDADTIDARVNLAFEMAAQGNHADAEKEFRAVYKLCQDLEPLGEERHSSTLHSRYNMADQMGLQGKYLEAEKEFRAVWEILRRADVLGEEHPDTLRARSKMAEQLWKLGKVEEAGLEILAIWQIESRPDILGEEHPDALKSRADYAYLLSEQRNHKEAEAEYRAIFETYRLSSEFGEIHSETLLSRYKVAGQISLQGRHKEAEDEFRAVWEVERRADILGEKHPSTLDTRSMVAQQISAQGRPEEAEREFRRIWEHQRDPDVLGEEHRDTITSQERIANELWKQGQHIEAETELRAIYEIKRRPRVFGELHPDTLGTRLAIAQQIGCQGRHAEAERELQSLWNVMRDPEVLGSDHRTTVKTKFNMAHQIAAQGRHVEAEQEFRAVLEVERRKEVLGESHFQTLNTRLRLAEQISAQGRHEEAGKEFFTVWEVGKDVLGEQHQVTLSALTGLAQQHAKLRKHTEAEVSFKALWEAQSKPEVLGVKHPNTLNTLHSLAQQIGAQGRHIEAERQLHSVLELMRQSDALGDDHTWTLTVHHNLAGQIAAQGRHKDAEREFSIVAAAFKEALGTNHPNTVTTRCSLGVQISAQERHEEAERVFREVCHTLRNHTDVGPGDLRTLIAQGNAAREAAYLGRLEDAKNELYEVWSSIVGMSNSDETHLFANNARANLARVLGSLERYDEAEMHLRAAINSRRVGGDTIEDECHRLRWTFFHAEILDNCEEYDTASGLLEGIDDRFAEFMVPTHYWRRELLDYVKRRN